MKLRKYHRNDTSAIIRLFYNTVREINIRDYTLEQVKAWAPDNVDEEKWETRLSNCSVFVVENDTRVIGFSELENIGHINCFYSDKDYQGKGVGSLMMENIETEAKQLGLKKLYTDVSITAKPFFEKKGFNLIKEQEVELRGVSFINYLMEKCLYRN